MKCQTPFTRKNKKNISKCRLLKFLPSLLSVIGCLVYFSVLQFIEEFSLINANSVDPDLQRLIWVYSIC